MTVAELTDLKTTINWLLENGEFKDTETSYNTAMNSVNILEKQCDTHVLISRLLRLKRYETSTGAGWEGSGAVWTELDEDKDGDLVKFKDVQKIIDEFNSL